MHSKPGVEFDELEKGIQPGEIKLFMSWSGNTRSRDYSDLISKLQRKAEPTLISDDIEGVAPMTGPKFNPEAFVRYQLQKVKK